jgi:hypothetical protein
MPFESEKTMFEVYKESTYSSKYCVVYFTELQDHNKETEINRAMAGEHFLDGFIKDRTKEDAKEIIDSLLKRMNSGESLRPEEFLSALGDHLA